MDTGQILNIVVTVIAILGAGAVALVCDLLKTSNERLREANLELRVRRDEERRRTQLALEQLERVQVTAERALAAVSATARPALPAGSDHAALRIGQIPAITSGETQGLSPADDPEHGVLENDQHGSVAGGTIEEARALARAITPAVGCAANPVQKREARIAPLTEVLTAASGSRKNWDLLLRNAPRPKAGTPFVVSSANGYHGHRGELIQFKAFPNAPESLELPGGFHPFAALAHFLETQAGFRGMVVAIGVSGIKGFRADGSLPDDALLESVETFLETVLRPFEFASPMGNGRYVVITPDRDGAAQTRFDELTADLWNFALRSGEADTHFVHCGGFEADREALSDAVSAAVLHMEANRDAGSQPKLETVRHRLAV